MRLQVSNSVKQWFDTDHTYEGDCKQLAQFQTEANDFNNSLQGVEFENIDSVFVRAEGVKIDGINKSVFISCGSFIEALRAIESENIKQGKAKDNKNINAYVNLSNYVANVAVSFGWSVYPASYGLGVCLVWNHKADQGIKAIKDYMTAHNIEFQTQYSEGGFVYRFLISKAKANINRLQRLA